MNVAIFTVGSNPLPIYVVAEYLLMDQRQDKKELPKPDCLVFVYSNESKEVYENITKKIIEKNSGKIDIKTVPIGNNERNRSIVIDSIKQKLTWINENKKSISSLHLNFSGGTKVMSVYSYIAVEEFAEEHQIKTIFSDIDPDTAKLSIGNNYVGSDLRNIVMLNINKILELHGMTFSRMKGLNLNVDIQSLAKKIMSLIKTGNDFWRKKEKTCKQNDSDNDTKEKKIELYKNNFGALFPFDQEQISHKPTLVEDFEKYLEGQWLEDYMFHCIQQIKDNFSITELKKSVEAKKDGRPCELDIIAIKGYQLYLFSCTTSSNIKVVKGKAFEALYRANQLGGSHARVVIVSMIANEKKLELEKDLLYFDAKINNKCKLIGFEELLDQNKLQDKLYEVFRD